MQNFWWNRKFYHGTDEPDSFRLHRLEEEQTAAASAIEALTQAQTALDGLMNTYGTVLSEHSSLLADLTAICEALKTEVQAVTVECDELGNELLALEDMDESLSKRIDALEDTCADTAAEQETAIAAASAQLAEQETAIAAASAQLTAQETRLGTVEEELPALSEAIAAVKPYVGGVGAIGFYSNGGQAQVELTGLQYGSPVTFYKNTGEVEHYFLDGTNATTLSVPDGINWIYGKAEAMTVHSGMLHNLDLTEMHDLKQLTLTGGAFDMTFSEIPHLTKITLDNISSLTGKKIDLSNQTALQELIIRDVFQIIEAPDHPKNLVHVVLDRTYAQYEAFLDKLLPDNSGGNAYRIYSPIEIPFPFVAERNWIVEVG